MKTVLLSGGLGARLSEETAARPKPMVEIGGGLSSPSSLLNRSGAAIMNEVLAVGDVGVIRCSIMFSGAAN